MRFVRNHGPAGALPLHAQIERTGKEEVMTKLSPEEARQGRKGKPVLYVLLTGLVFAGALALVLHPYEQDAGTLDTAQSIEETTAVD
jgi:hypothetical protein